VRLLAIAWKEILQLRRDRLTLAMAIALPVMQLMLFGYAINSDVRNMPTVVYDQDHSAESRDLARTLQATGFYDLVGEVHSYAEITRAIRSDRARVALVIAAGYASALERGLPARVQLIVDGSDPSIVASATNTASALVSARSAELVAARLSRAGAGGESVTPIELEPNTWFNPELRTAINIVPGLVGIILTMTMVMLTAMAIARERERGTLEQLIVSPIRNIELIVGKIAPYIAIGYGQMTLILVAGHGLFDVPMLGSLPLLYVLAFLFIAANLALGLFFSTLARTQQQAMQMAFFFFLPNILLSGFMFPFDGMPVPAQWLAQCLPLTHFLRIVRGIVLKGSGLGELWPEVGALALILGVLVVVASLRFRKKLG
jgi:ABC-2 type transport system permease protein